MSVETHLEQAIRNLEAENATVADATKDRVMREKIIPYNQEIDEARDNAVAERQATLNATIAAQQESFEKEKQQMFEAAEKKKSDNMNAVIASETYAVTVEYDKAISKLKEQIANLKK